jgi:hypothetical protein
MDDPALQRRVGRAFEHFVFDLPLEAIVAPTRRPARSWLRLATTVVVSLVVVLAIGVLLGRQLATPTSVFGSWQPVPSLADPKLAAAARSDCLHEGEADASLLIQDQRGLAAELLFRNGNDMIMCVAFFEADGEIGAATSSGTHLSAQATTFGLDSVGRAPGFSANPGLTWLFGHQPTSTAAVVLMLEDGTKVTASMSAGWFIAWWPSEQTVASMSTLDARGNSVTVIAPEASAVPWPTPTAIPSSTLLPNPGGTCSASQFALGTPTYSYGYGTLGSKVMFVTVPLRNTGASCVLNLPAVIGVAAATGPFQSVPVIRPGPVTSWASESGQSLPMVIGAWWWVGVRDESGNAVLSAPPCADPIFDVMRVEFPFALGSTMIDLPAAWDEVCSSPASLSVALETKS